MAKSKRYDDPEYNKFRLAVLKRDKYKCQMPKCKSRKKLQVHHIIPYSKSTYLRLEPKNGITLCRCCHDSIKNKELHYIKLFTSIVERNN